MHSAPSWSANSSSWSSCLNFSAGSQATSSESTPTTTLSLVSAWPFLDHDGPIPIAHRGGAAEGPENTMAAFAAAIDLGYRYVETDVHATRDEVLVAFHDEGLQRLSGRPEAIADLNWRDLKTVRVGGEHAIPRFEELLEAWPDLRIAVDPKHDQATVPLIGALQRADAIDRVCVGSFSGRRLALARRLGGPRLCTGLSPKEVGQLQAASAGLPVKGQGRRVRPGSPKRQGCSASPPAIRGRCPRPRTFSACVDHRRSRRDAPTPRHGGGRHHDRPAHRVARRSCGARDVGLRVDSSSKPGLCLWLNPGFLGISTHSSGKPCGFRFLA